MRSYQGAQWEGRGDPSATEGGVGRDCLRLGPARVCLRAHRLPLGGGAKALPSKEEPGSRIRKIFVAAAGATWMIFLLYLFLLKPGYRVRKIISDKKTSPEWV